MNQGNPPPNWYPDPRGEGELRYWDGSQWTEHTHSGQAASAPAPAAPPPSVAPPPQSAAPSAPTAAGYQPTQADYSPQPQQGGYQQPQGGYQQPGGYGPGGPGGGPATGSGGGRGNLPLIIGGILAVIVIAAVAVIALSGGSSGPTEKDKVNKAAKEAIVSKDPATCRTLATQNYLQNATGESGQKAVSACEQSSGNLAPDADFTRTDVTGDRATVEAKLKGGNQDGETVILTMVKQSGAWKVDDLERTKFTSGPDATQAVTNTVLNFGSSEGPKACQYLSYTGLQRLGGVSGCQNEFKSATAANYTATDVTVSGKTASVVVTESRQGKTIGFKLSYSAGRWAIDSFKQQ
jgi:hypothetical protein